MIIYHVPLKNSKEISYKLTKYLTDELFKEDIENLYIKKQELTEKKRCFV